MMQLTIDDLRVLLNNGTVLWTTHCLQRMASVTYSVTMSKTVY